MRIHVNLHIHVNFYKTFEIFFFSQAQANDHFVNVYTWADYSGPKNVEFLFCASLVNFTKCK